ncbi:exo-alpha-sialidase, partial [Mannheimia indoligenes]|uniref:exo-alpha-sialidase n=1 Tax=Mannheimia indoligenes TaxID=3103145 RepID=UPI002FE620D9
MKKANFLKRTALSILISSAIASGVQATGTSFLDFSSVSDFGRAVNVTEQFNRHNVFSASSGTLTFRVKANQGFSTLLGVSDPSTAFNYVMFYANVKPNGKEQFGIEMRNGSASWLIPNAQLVTAELDRSADGFRTVTYTIDNAANQIKIYVDGQLMKTANRSGFFRDMPGLNTATVGSLTREVSGYNSNDFKGAIYSAGASDQVLNEDQVRAFHQQISNTVSINLQKEAERQAYLSVKREQLGAFMSDKFEMFKPGQGGAASYRIPGLLTTQDGVVIAAIDKRNQHASDWGNIDLAIRRSLDGGLTWQEDQVIVDLATQPYPNLGQAESALVIDAVMVQNKENGRISLVFDMFPESQALFGMFSNSEDSFRSEGNGHVKVGDKWYRLVTDASGARYTVREEGIIYDRNGVAQDYKVVVEGDPKIAFKDLGDIIQISTGERKGNIFLRSQKSGNDSGPFNAHYTSYLWVTHSDDNGATWSNPVDITTQIKEDWMRFLGTGPGTGIQLKDGTLMIPVYYTNRDNKQSAAVIVSKDGGVTWVRGESPNDAYLDEIGGSRYLNTNDYEITESQVVEMNNGDIKIFSRNRSGAVIISTSHDGGMTWNKGAKLREATLLDPYSQMSVIHYSKLIDGKEYLVFANPHASTRRNGVAWLGEVQEDGTILWKYSTTIDSGTYAYNSLTELPNGDIGLLYEQRQGENVQYVRFNLQELFWKENLIYRDIRDNDPERKKVSLNNLSDEEVFYKIGDGEMVKVGEGINPAQLTVKEGIATLNQTANAQNEKQAYSKVTVLEKGTLRLMDGEQLNLSNVVLQKGTFDLNGRDFTIFEDSNAKASGLRAETIDGNIVNHSDTEATLKYSVKGEHSILGKTGDDKGLLSLTYEPAEAASTLSLNGQSFLGTVKVNNGKLVYGPLEDNAHIANKINVAKDAAVELRDTTSLSAKDIELADSANLIFAPTEALDYTLLNANVSGKGNLVKKGAGYTKATGNFTHSGSTNIESGTFELDGKITDSKVTVSQNAILSGQGELGASLTLKDGSLVSPSRFIGNPSTFEGKTLVLNDVNNEGGSFLLSVNNNAESISDWKHDKVRITGAVDTVRDIAINIQLLGTSRGKSDTNNNGQYNADEGISLVQVKKAEDFERIKIGEIASATRSADLYPLTLVRVEAGATVAENNELSTVKDNQYYDFRLQNLLIKEDGTRVDPTIYMANNTDPDNGTDTGN